MKVLLDTCVSRNALNVLTAAGHDAGWAGDWPADPGDEEILKRALSEGRALVTIDKDFGELAVVRGIPHAGIVRLVGLRALLQGPVCLLILDRYGQELRAGAIVTADQHRVRIRPPEKAGE